MANDGGSVRVSEGLVAWLGRQLAALVSGEDLRVRNVIAGAVSQARSNHVAAIHPAAVTLHPVRHGRATKTRVE